MVSVAARWPQCSFLPTFLAPPTLPSYSRLSAPGQTRTVDGKEAGGKIKFAGTLAGGTIKLDKAGTQVGDPVTGTIAADISQPGHWSDPPP